MSTPTLINLPPPRSESVTPSDMGPGTPNSGTTSLSALSTTAIKDGHQGQPLPHGRHAHHSSATSMSSTNTLEAERADRISRLAGLERVATARASGQSQFGGSTTPAAHATSGYFESARERSTVGSASATGSVGGRTTWASGSDAFDGDKMSEDQDDGASSVSNISDEGNASLVGFGEGASTISGPTSSSRPNLNRVSSAGRTPSSLGSPSLNNRSHTSNSNSSLYNNPIAAYLQNTSDSPMMPSPLSPAGSNAPEQSIEDARMLDGMTYDADVVDTTTRTPRFATPFNNEGSTENSEQGSGR